MICASLAKAGTAMSTTRPPAAARGWCCGPTFWKRRSSPPDPRRAGSCRSSTFRRAASRRLAACDGVTLLCGRFEGVDQRVLDHFGIEEVSLGDFVLTGGEIAAQALLDATIRLLPGVLGNAASTEEESFSAGLLEHPQYTRPAVWQGREIPPVLMSGHHAEIGKWRKAQAEKITKERRPDLWAAHEARKKP
jgi:tRNA (guanine37-N1)-methyltransferase